jgi:TRAP-type mannitol/chloroaromatic compound transport system permease large subunit
MKRWLYVVIVLVVQLVCAALGEFNHQLSYLAAGSVAMAVLTHPLGIAAQLVALPLIYLGIATPTEAAAMAAPLFALLGYVQWYVVFPRLARRMGGREPR